MKNLKFLSASSTNSAIGLTLALIVLSALSLQSIAQDIDFDTLEERAGYGVGINIGMNLVGQGIAEDLDNDAVIMGIVDALGGADFQLAEDDIVAALQEFTLIQQAKAEAAVAQEAQASESFLIDNASKAGVTTTASGLQYAILTEGAAGGASPTVDDTVNVHYHGTLPDGSVFDSSVDRGEPVSFPVGAVIPGWTEGLQLMSIGDKYQFVIPSDLAYGPNGAGGVIGPNATLVFEVELLGIE